MIQCIQNLEGSVALLVRQQNTIIEEQKNAMLDQRKYREEPEHGQKIFQDNLVHELKTIKSCQDMIKNPAGNDLC